MAQVVKTVNSAFIVTGLQDHLRAAGLDTLVVAGLTELILSKYSLMTLHWSNNSGFANQAHV